MAQTAICRGTATSVCGNKDNLVVTYHNTVVVHVVDGEITLDTGGWKTRTTKTRMNQASRQFGLGFSVYQQKGEWFVDYQGETVIFGSNRLTLKPETKAFRCPI